MISVRTTAAGTQTQFFKRGQGFKRSNYTAGIFILRDKQGEAPRDFNVEVFRSTNVDALKLYIPHAKLSGVEPWNFIVSAEMTDSE